MRFSRKNENKPQLEEKIKTCNGRTTTLLFDIKIGAFFIASKSLINKGTQNNFFAHYKQNDD